MIDQTTANGSTISGTGMIKSSYTVTTRTFSTLHYQWYFPGTGPDAESFPLHVSLLLDTWMARSSQLRGHQAHQTMRSIISDRWYRIRLSWQWLSSPNHIVTFLTIARQPRNQLCRYKNAMNITWYCNHKCQCMMVISLNSDWWEENTCAHGTLQ
jgi:hypothetical protein